MYDYSSSYHMPYIAKFDANLNIRDAQKMNTHHYWIQQLHAGASTGWNYKMFALATGYSRSGGDR